MPLLASVDQAPVATVRHDNTVDGTPGAGPNSDSLLVAIGVIRLVAALFQPAACSGMGALYIRSDSPNE